MYLLLLLKKKKELIMQNAYDMMYKKYEYCMNFVNFMECIIV